jgi:DNA mismatch repair protein MSH5
VAVEYVPQVGYLVAVQEAEVHILEHALPSALCPASGPARAHQSLFQDQDGDFMAWDDTADPYGDGFTDVQENEGFRFVFKQSGVHYFKHRIVEELDASIGDIKSDIADRQRALLLQVEDTLLESESALQQLALSLSTLDALISLGALAVEQRLTAPEIVEESVILIKGGQHLLQELTVDNFVANDAFISPDKNVALISGPNTSGKSVYLKQVGIIVYLAHIGSFVPCERARIGLTDRIMTRISSTETVSAPQSAFALDLAQVSRMLRYHTPRTLCLVDEFGKGTMPVDGIALLAAVVKHFAQRGGAALFVLHFTEILHDAVLSSAVLQRVSCFRMETLLQASESQEDREGYQERTPLFTLKKGVATSSEGIPCARSAGVGEDVLRRAAEVKSLVSQRQAIQPVGSRSRSIVQNPRNMELLALFLKTQNWAGDEGAENLGKFKDLL